MSKIDVSDCKYLSIFDNKTCKLLLEETETVKINTNMFDCINCPDCYYKQLKQSEQENAELKAENERLYEEKDCLHKIIDRLLENAGYSKDIASAEDFEDVYENMQYKNNKLEEYKQTLQEIKAIAEEYHHNKPRLLCNMDKFIEQILQKIIETEKE